MASSSGMRHSGEFPARSLSRRMSRVGTVVGEAPEDEPGTINAELVPSSLANIIPVLRVADEIQEENPTVAYLCRFHAFEMAHKLDSTSAGRGVRQFKTALLHKLEKDEKEGPQPTKAYAREIQKFYKEFYEKNIKEQLQKRTPDEMAKNCQIASVLYDVLENLVPKDKISEEILKYALEVEKIREQYVPYNILPLHAIATTPPIMNVPEIKAAVHALKKIHGLPWQSSVRTAYHDSSRQDLDLFDWLWSVFGFQKSNVENQREHLVLLLANVATRNKYHQESNLIDDSTLKYLMGKIFKNYYGWCAYLHQKRHINTSNARDKQQMQLLYIGLYLLIWGEAANLRFMPECLCYIFHHMAYELNGLVCGNVSQASGQNLQLAYTGEESFLLEVVTPIYNVIREEARKSAAGTASHSKWRNYDDLNEYFWSEHCFKLGWPMDRKADFFLHTSDHKIEDYADEVRQRKPKTNFVEVRTFWHLFRSFDRLWIFFILALQAMIIIAWNSSGPLMALSQQNVVKSVSSIFITASILNFLQALLDIVLCWKAWGSMSFSQILRYILKLVVAAVWAVVLPFSYGASWDNPTGLVRLFSSWTSSFKSQSLYGLLVAIYLIPNILAAILFMVPLLQRALERSNWRIIVFLLWWAQSKLYVGRGMHESMVSLLKYTLFWILLLISKLAFSYYVEIQPLIDPTRIIIGMGIGNYEWHEFFPNVKHNIGVVISIWAPIILVYFMDAQIWYAIFSTIFGGIRGAFSHLGEIRTLGMLRSRFGSVPVVFNECLVPKNEDDNRENMEERKKVAKFQYMWNEFIYCLRDEDLISNKERDLLLVPYPPRAVSVVQWPPFLLVSKIPAAIEMAKDFKGKLDERLFKKIKSDDYMLSAVVEFYETFRALLCDILEQEDEKEVIKRICIEAESSIKDQSFLSKFRMSGLPQLSNKLEKFLGLLKNASDDNIVTDRTQVINSLQDVVEVITQDIMAEGHGFLEGMFVHKQGQKGDSTGSNKDQKFAKINIDLIKKGHWYFEVSRMHLLLTVKESAANVPMNLDARRRITFFTNSLFMKIPRAPKVHEMVSFSVLTPYFKEDVLLSENDIQKENEDGITTLFYLQKIYPDEWSNLLERCNLSKDKPIPREHVDDLCRWVSYRAQTLSRTVRGMMYYRRALALQCFLDMADDSEILGGDRREVSIEKYLEQQNLPLLAIADMKFTFVVSCQVYGQQKKSSDSRDRSCSLNILNLMLEHPSLRVAYVDERDETINGRTEKVYYSVLVKGYEKRDEEIYRIKLPGSPIIGEGKPENQNHAIIFTRGEALQTIDMNQDNYLEEAFKMRNVLQEFSKPHGLKPPTILGLREHIFTGSVSSLAWFMSNQETSFVTIGQRVLANPLKVRFHYGHPDIFDRIFHLTRGGISKASKGINLSEDIFSGYNSTLRGGNITHHEYIQVGKGRDVGMNQISLFEAKVSNGNGEQTLSRDVYRLGRRFDFYRMLSFYFTTVGFYFSSMVTVLIVYVFLYGRLYLVLSGLEKELLRHTNSQQSKALESALATQSVFQLGLLLVLPMVMEIGLEKGFRTAIGEFIIMQLQLAPVFFTFQLGTKAHYYGRTILHGGAKYRPTGRGFGVEHLKFAANYRMYSRSHFVKGLELMILLIVYQVYGTSYSTSNVYLFVTFSMWFLVASWLFAPSVFNPSGFEWQKTVDDFTDWTRWVGNRGGIGIQADKSWESWWEEEQVHLKYTDMRGRLLEILLALRFFIYQYGIVYHLNIAHHNKSILVYGLSWLVMATVLLVLKMVSMGRRKFGTDFQLMFRILKALLFLGFVSVLTVLFVVCGLTIADVFAALLGFLPTGWAFLLIGPACRPVVRKIGLWESIKELARTYEYIMGLIIFAPIAVLSWFPFMSEFQTRLLFNQAFSRGLQISRILAGKKDSTYEIASQVVHKGPSDLKDSVGKKG
ncbi:callose synthase 7-like [Nymphaea colorata]|nr:callose synthase 7-like [Nymphaea colorata]